MCGGVAIANPGTSNSSIDFSPRLKAGVSSAHYDEHQDSKDDSDTDRGDSKRAPMHPVEAVDIAATQGAINRGVKIVIHGGMGLLEMMWR